MELHAVALAVLGLFAAGVLKGATGLGYATCALPFLVMAVRLKAAIVVVIAPAIASNVTLLAQTKGLLETARAFAPLYFALIPGILIGSTALFLFDEGLATRVLGAVTFCYALLAAVRPDLRLPVVLQRRLQVPVGLVNGMVSGFTGSQIMPLLPYMLSLRLDPDRFVQAVNLSVTLTSLVLAASFLFHGALTGHLFLISLLGCLPAISGAWSGVWLRRFVPVRFFRPTVLAVLAFLGAMLFMKSGG